MRLRPYALALLSVWFALPSSAAQTTDTTPTWSWSAASGSPVGYDVFVSRNGGTMTLEQQVSGTTVTLNASVGERLVVRVRARDAAGGIGPDSPDSEAVDILAAVDARWTENGIGAPRSGTLDSPYLSPDGLSIYFSYTPLAFRDFAEGTSSYPVGEPLPGHHGTRMTDLYVMQYDPTTQKWGPPQNLGDGVNTATASEVGPWVSADGKTLLFYRHDDANLRQGMKSTRASTSDPWGVAVPLGGDYGAGNQTPTRTRADFHVHEPTGEVFLWEHRDASVSSKLGHLGRGVGSGYAWSAPAYYDAAAWDLDGVDEAQPWLTKDGLTLLFSRRRAGQLSELWKATRTSTSAAFSDPTKVSVPAGLDTWGEVSADSAEQGLLAVGIDFATNPGGSTHLLYLPGKPGDPVTAYKVLNPYVAYVPPTQPPSLNVTPSSVTLDLAAGATGTTDVEIRNTGGGTLSYLIANSHDWLQPSVRSGDVVGSEVDVLRLTVTAPTSGSQTGVVTVVQAGTSPQVERYVLVTVRAVKYASPGRPTLTFP